MCRMIDRKKVWSDANSDLAFTLQGLLTNNSPWFKEAHLWDQGVVQDNSDTNTGAFQIILSLKQPIKL